MYDTMHIHHPKIFWQQCHTVCGMNPLRHSWLPHKRGEQVYQFRLQHSILTVDC